MDLNLILKKTKSLVVDNSPLLLTYVAVAGVVTTAILAAKAVPKAFRSIGEFENDSFVRTGMVIKPTPKELVLMSWKDFLPAGISGAVTIGAIVASNTISTKRNAALVTVYSLAETAYKEYREKVREHVGDLKAKKFKDDIAKDHLLDVPMATSQVYITGLGEQLCYDSYTGRLFKSDIETIRRAQNDINAKILRDMYASHNEFYTLIGLEKTAFGEEIGWTAEYQLDIEFSSHLAADGRPALCIEYRTEPVRNYYKFG